MIRKLKGYKHPKRELTMFGKYPNPVEPYGAFMIDRVPHKMLGELTKSSTLSEFLG